MPHLPLLRFCPTAVTAIVLTSIGIFGGESSSLVERTTEIWTRGMTRQHRLERPVATTRTRAATTWEKAPSPLRPQCRAESKSCVDSVLYSSTRHVVCGTEGIDNHVLYLKRSFLFPDAQGTCTHHHTVQGAVRAVFSLFIPYLTQYKNGYCILLQTTVDHDEQLSSSSCTAPGWMIMFDPR